MSWLTTDAGRAAVVDVEKARKCLLLITAALETVHAKRPPLEAQCAETRNILTKVLTLAEYNAQHVPRSGLDDYPVVAIEYDKRLQNVDQSLAVLRKQRVYLEGLKEKHQRRFEKLWIQVLCHQVYTLPYELKRLIYKEMGWESYVHPWQPIENEAGWTADDWELHTADDHPPYFQKDPVGFDVARDMIMAWYETGVTLISHFLASKGMNVAQFLACDD